MTNQEIAALTDAQLNEFIANMGNTKNVLLERAKSERKRRNSA